MGKLLSNKKVLVVIVLGIIVAISLGQGIISTVKDNKARQEALKRAEENKSTEVEISDSNSEDAYLIQIQDSLIQSYGKLPEGYIWQTDGTLLSLGDKNMTAEEVVYAYFNGLRSLDISLAQKYSRGSRVVDTYSGYFDVSNQNTDYYTSFFKNMYKQCLLSLQVTGISDVSTFAENKQVFTVKLKMLDLTSKDFWEKDKETIYNNLYIYNTTESDSTKGEMYLYNYVLDYYKSTDAKLRDFDVNITVQKYSDLNTGWLVSIDTDVDNACKYSDGTTVIKHINSMYLSEGMSIVKPSN